MRKMRKKIQKTKRKGKVFLDPRNEVEGFLKEIKKWSKDGKEFKIVEYEVSGVDFLYTIFADYEEGKKLTKKEFLELIKKIAKAIKKYKFVDNIHAEIFRDPFAVASEDWSYELNENTLTINFKKIDEYWGLAVFYVIFNKSGNK